MAVNRHTAHSKSALFRSPVSRTPRLVLEISISAHAAPRGSKGISNSRVGAARSCAVSGEINSFGSLRGVRDENALESAIAERAERLSLWRRRHLKNCCRLCLPSGRKSAWFDGNKRTGVQAALVFLEGCGIDTSRLPERQTYAPDDKNRNPRGWPPRFSDYLRSELGRERTA